MKHPVQRHRTAINRSGLTRPFQYLARHGFLDGGNRVLDYGCGRGGDLELLRGNGIPAAGWARILLRISRWKPRTWSTWGL